MRHQLAIATLLLATLLGARAAAHGNALDADGVQALLPAQSGGSTLALGTGNPNTDKRFGFDYKGAATAAQEGGLRYWSLPATPLTYSSGGNGYTARLHLFASGGQQQFTWKTQRGYLSSPHDVRNQEFTVYVRVHEPLTPLNAQVTLKIRGGRHSEKDGDAASSTMMTFGPSGPSGITRFAKELTHPLYDYVVLRPLLNVALQPGQWYGLKLISYSRPGVAGEVLNQLYVDTAPFDAAGRPANGWQLLSEYTDVQGKRTGRHYDTLADWGGWQTTLRMDGYRSIDFALPSVREVAPPAP
ncbi:hypothetical protein os4_11460 [Comamonadaceae bacterium OS-4]|nr:hypothetical protein os4_11460 [Comamonadaceae bacterium OS-4]